jgi:hypothetical protein
MKNITFKLSKILLLTSFLYFGQACIKLEEDTSAVLLLENLTGEGDITAALAPMYRQMLDLVTPPHEWMMAAYGADDMTTWWAGNKAPLRVFDRFDYGSGENSAILWLDAAWISYWKNIYYSNSLIDGLKTSTAPEAVIKNGDAEARWWRAYAYLSLVKFYGNMPKILDGYKPTGKEPRTTVLDNYKHIEADLLIAEANLPLPGAVKSVGRLSSAAAKTLLADLYTTWSGWPVKDAGKYALAAVKAKEVIDMNYFELLPIDKLWLTANGNGKESIIALQPSRSEDIRNTFPASFNFHMSRGWSDAYPEKKFFNDFPAGPRKTYTFRTDIPNRDYVGGKVVNKTPPTVPWQNSERFHPAYLKWNISEEFEIFDRCYSYRPIELFRYAELLLIYAEASARSTGGSATGPAVEAYNMVRRRAAGLPFNTPNASVDVSSATAEQILAEKGWELAGENKRWYDLVRTETVGAITAKRDPTEQVTLAKSASAINWQQYIAPIPYNAIITSDLVQNPEGFKIQ